MTEPLFWLGLSILLVAVSLAAVLIVALPALLELARAARSAEKLFDTLNRELPPTLEAIRLTGQEIANLSEDVGQNVQSAGRVVEQLDQSLTTMKQQAHQAQITTRSMMAGVKAAWQVFSRSPQKSPSKSQLAEETTEPELLSESANAWEVVSLDAEAADENLDREDAALLSVMPESKSSDADQLSSSRSRFSQTKSQTHQSSDRTNSVDCPSPWD